MLQETWTLRYSRHHSSFNQEGLHLGVGAEAFLIKALIDSTDDKINSPIKDPKLILGSLGVAWCTSTNLQSGWSASLSWKRWLDKQPFTLSGNISIEMVKALIGAYFCERLLC